MSQITKFTIMGLLLLAGLLFMAGCGSSTPNSKASSSANTEGQHAADWLPAGHMVAAQEDQSACTECHGSNYDGGISGVSCTTCHLGGAMSIHPTSWGIGTGIDLNHAAYVASNGTGACANAFCHGSTLTGVVGSGPACVSAACHQNGSPFTFTGCTSCHGNPPTGSSPPNRNGSHSAHNAFSGGANVCDVCHSGAGTNTLVHNNGVVDVAFLSVFNAKSGTAVYNGDGTCSKVSCHGGQQTPAWLTGTIDVTTQCTSCHVYGTAPATPEYNSYYSGQHDYHVNTRQWQSECWRCHDTTKPADVHFVSLNTTTLGGQAYLTLQSYLTYTKGAVTGTGTCNAICHPGVRTW